MPRFYRGYRFLHVCIDAFYPLLLFVYLQDGKRCFQRELSISSEKRRQFKELDAYHCCELLEDLTQLYDGVFNGTNGIVACSQIGVGLIAIECHLLLLTGIYQKGTAAVTNATGLAGSLLIL